MFHVSVVKLDGVVGTMELDCCIGGSEARANPYDFVFQLRQSIRGVREAI